MGLLDWLIVVLPTAFILWMGFHSRKYVRGVTDFLSAGRVAGRYMLSMGDVANALSVIGIVAYVEVHYKTGFALVFWNNILLPLGVLMSLFGYCTYRFRETRAMSLGQFLEMRYSRSLRIFAAVLRSISEMLANMIMPAVAARFFIYFLDLPREIDICGHGISTFVLIMVVCLAAAISILCFGGTLALLVTDALQGMLLFPLMSVFVVFILFRFSWSTEIVTVMYDRAPQESFLNPYDIQNLRDFNLLLVIVTVVAAIIHRASWFSGGYSTAAKSPHEQKMAALLGTWRNALSSLFYVLIALCIITCLNHVNFSGEARTIRTRLSGHITDELVAPENRADFIRRIASVPEQRHVIGVDEPLSQALNLDTPTLEAAHEAFKNYEGEEEGNSRFQQFRTLYHQMMIASGMREILPPVMTGLFCLLLVLAMISTDDTRIFSASLTFTQDVILPFCKNGLSPKTHIRLLRITSIGVGIFFLIGSGFMSQLDYINLFVTFMTMMWLGGCGPVMIFGLYSRFGNTAGAFASLISGMTLSFLSIFVMRNWADRVYPWLVETGWDDNVSAFLDAISAPLNPYVVWKMDPVKFPINSYELYLLTMIITFAVFCAVSAATQKAPFNLERMLHRGIYNTEGENKSAEKWSWKTLASKLIGITPEYTTGDRVIAWGVFLYSFIYQFFLTFIFVIIWNAVTPWPLEWWGNYFFITTLFTPGIIAFISSFWFGIGGVADLFRLFRDLKRHVSDPLDNGQVDGHVSLADKANFSRLEAERNRPR